MTGLSVDTSIPEGVDLLGKELDDIQSGVAVSASGITGTLKYISGWTAFSGDPAEQSGNYLALHVDSPTTGATLKAQVLGGDHGEVTLDSDKTVIFRIKNTDQKIKITASADGKEDTVKVYSLTYLNLEEAS